jgi:hypothetical protein
LLLGVVLGGLLLGGAAEPSDTSAEVGFARDMSVHHGQAVEMAFIIRDRTDDPDIRLLAYDIINTQRAQIGMFTLCGDGLCIGRDSADSVSAQYRAPNRFTGGTINRVAVDVSGEPYVDLERQAQVLIKSQ